MVWYKKICEKFWLAPWVLAGGLLGGAFVWSGLWLVGLVGIAYIFHLTLTESSWRRVILGSIAAWTIKSALALAWFWSVYPITWLDIGSGGLQIGLIGVWWFTAALWLGLGGGLFGLLVFALQKRLPVGWLYTTIPALWLLAELVGSLIFSILTIGPGGAVTTAFSFGYVGYLLAPHPWLLQLASLGGVYALGLFAVALAVGLLVLVQNRPQYRGYFFGIVVVLYATSFIPLPVSTVETTEERSVVMIDTAFSPAEFRTSEGRAAVQVEIKSAVDAALALQPDYILLPEDSRYFDQQTNPALTQAQFSFLNNSPSTIILDSGRTTVDDQVVLQSYIYNGVADVVDQSQKRYLVPQGEFMPALYAGALRLFGQGDVVALVEQSLAYQVGLDTSQSDFASSSPGVLFCFESVSPWGVRQIMQERGDVPFIAHPVSHAWFNNPRTLWLQLQAMLAVQAVWNRQYIVSSGNMVAGYVVTPAGTIEQPQVLQVAEQWSLHQVNIP